ncbi:hypothetical protein NQ314_019296 [Rhamnusium bicolor]|uniref:PiggyBac transposable element-derived protein domain-containing protein n=1 Tax=Rhamnusium bicolor TaxID=1586634 RepID=A0AAV8WMZ3_9CUCU|nr:hypothetical protein NQ314_019296 [Rhamnusium bicolor]
MKPIKRGYKLWCLADQKGFINKFDGYQGKNAELAEKFIEFGLGEKKTLWLVELFVQKKNCPTNMTEDKQMKRGDYDYRLSSSDISYFRWNDNKCVHFCSNFHGTEVTSVSRKQKDGSKIDVPCPTIVSDYNKHMGAVGHAEQLRGSYGTDCRSKNEPPATINLEVWVPPDYDPATELVKECGNLAPPDVLVGIYPWN